MSREGKRTKKNQELDLKAEIDRANNRSDGTFTFSVVAGAVGLGIELLENEKAHASEDIGDAYQPDGATSHAAVDEAHQQSQTISEADISARQTAHDASAQLQDHMPDPASLRGAAAAVAEGHVATAALDGTQQSASLPSGHAAAPALDQGGAPILDNASAAGQGEALVQDGSSEGSDVVHVASLQPIGEISDVLSPITGPGSGSLADGLLTGIGGAVSGVLEPVVNLLGDSEGGGLLPNVLLTVENIIGGADESLLDGVSSLVDGLGVSAVLDPVTDLLSTSDDLVSDVLSTAGNLLGGGHDEGLLPDVISTVTGGLGGFGEGTSIASNLLSDVTHTLDNVLNVSTALAPAMDLLSGTDGRVSDVLSVAENILGGGPDDEELLPDVISTLTGGLGSSGEGSNVASDLLSVVTDTLDTGSSDSETALDTASASTHESVSAHEGNIVSDLLSPVTGGLHDDGGEVTANDAVSTTTADGGSGLISNLTPKITAVLGGGQDAGTASGRGEGTDHSGLVPGMIATATTTLEGAGEAGVTHALDITASTQPNDLPALPGVGDVLDLTSSLVGVIVPKLGYIGQPHFEAEEHHDFGNSHGSVLHGHV